MVNTHILYVGVSRYCVVDNFLKVQGRSFAVVRWLSTPHYPYYPNLLVVRVRMPCQRHQPCMMLVIEAIQPTSVAVDPDKDGVHFFLIRSKGTDRTVV